MSIGCDCRKESGCSCGVASRSVDVGPMVGNDVLCDSADGNEVLLRGVVSDGCIFIVPNPKTSSSVGRGGHAKETSSLSPG